MLSLSGSFAVAKLPQTPKPRDYLSRREQWRLLLLVMSLGLVVVLMIEARDPDNWAWFSALSGGGGGLQSSSASPDDAPTDNPLRPAPPKKETPGTSVSPGPGKAQEKAAGRYFPGVNPRYLQSIRDDTVSRPEERDAWFHLLKILKETDEATLRRESTGRVTYSQLFRQSGEYRGELVTIRGTIRRTSLPPVIDNDYGIDGYYRTVFQPADDRSKLIFVYCLYLPKGFPKGTDVSADVEVTGFYFKRWNYQAQEAVLLAPVLLAKTVRWQQAPPAADKTPAGVGSIVAMIAGVLCVSLLLAFYVYRRTQPTPSSEPGPPPQFDALGDVHATSAARPPQETADRQGPGG